MANKQWGDDDDDDVNREIQDANGLVERIKFHTNSKGQKIKSVTKLRVSEIKLKTPKRVELRKNLPRFGDAKMGEENVTNPSKEWVLMEHPDDQLVEDVDDPGMAKTLANFIIKQQETKAARELEMDNDDMNDYKRDRVETQSSGLEPQSDKYVPPGAKQGGPVGVSSLDKLAQSQVLTEANTTTIRVSNLTKAITDGDLHDLFAPFGRILRISLPRVEKTKEPRGFAYVAYYNRSDAEKAMEKLNGHGYDHLIIKLEWTVPSQHSSAGGGSSGLGSSYTSGYGTKLAQGKLSMIFNTIIIYIPSFLFILTA